MIEDVQVYNHVAHYLSQGLRKSLAPIYQENEHELS